MGNESLERRCTAVEPLSHGREAPGGSRGTSFYVLAARVETAVYLGGDALQGRARLCGRCCAALQPRSQALASGCLGAA